MEEKLKAVKVRAVYGERVVEAMYYPDMPTDEDDWTVCKTTKYEGTIKCMKDPNNPTRPYKCPHCVRRFKFPYEVRRHSECHNEKYGRYTYKCQNCGIVFPANAKDCYYDHLQICSKMGLKPSHPKSEEIEKKSKPVIVNEYLDDSSDESSADEIPGAKVVAEVPKLNSTRPREPPRMPPLALISRPRGSPCFKMGLKLSPQKSEETKKPVIVNEYLDDSSDESSADEIPGTVAKVPKLNFTHPTEPPGTPVLALINRPRLTSEMKKNLMLSEIIGNPNEALPSKCSNCFKTIEDKDKMRAHLLLHLKLENELINQTHKKTKKIEDKTKSCELDEQCPYCNKVFLSGRLKRAHILNDHRGFPTKIKTDFPLVCTICNEMCDNQIDLIEHVKQHPDILPYECAHCWQRFRHKFPLKLHIIGTHAGLIKKLNLLKGKY